MKLKYLIIILILICVVEGYFLHRSYEIRELIEQKVYESFDNMSNKDEYIIKPDCEDVVPLVETIDGFISKINIKSKESRWHLLSYEIPESVLMVDRSKGKLLDQVIYEFYQSDTIKYDFIGQKFDFSSNQWFYDYFYMKNVYESIYELNKLKFTLINKCNNKSSHDGF